MSDDNLSLASQSREAFETLVAAIEKEPSDKFVDLVAAAGKNPKVDLCFGDFSGCCFDEQNLRGFNFTGCNLRGATFLKAKINGAIFDGAHVSLSSLRGASDFSAFRISQLVRKPASRFRPVLTRLNDFEAFRYTPFLPEMIVIPAGEYLMGADASERKRPENDHAFDDEIGPRGKKRLMHINNRFAIGKYLVTFDEYDAYCRVVKMDQPDAGKWGRHDRPVINVTWFDAHKYIKWLNQETGGIFRLPSEAEWEYACRAGTITNRWWGNSWDPDRANCAGTHKRTTPVGKYPANPWGLHDMNGNVWEWCEDIWTENIGNLPDGGAAYNPKSRKKDRPIRALRGGSWSYEATYSRSAARGRQVADGHSYAIGFRLAQSL